MKSPFSLHKRFPVDTDWRLKERTIALTCSQYAVPLFDRLFAQPIFASNDLVGDPKMPTKPVVTQRPITSPQAV